MLYTSTGVLVRDSLESTGARLEILVLERLELFPTTGAGLETLVVEPFATTGTGLETLVVEPFATAGPGLETLVPEVFASTGSGLETLVPELFATTGAGVMEALGPAFFATTGAGGGCDIFSSVLGRGEISIELRGGYQWGLI